MLIRNILIFLVVVIIILAYFTLRNIILEQRVFNRQKMFGNPLISKRSFHIHYVYITLLMFTTIGLYTNATDIFIWYAKPQVVSSCAFSLDDHEAVVEWSENIFVARIDELSEVREFNILVKNHSLLEDYYQYSFTRIEDILGDSSMSKTLQVTRSVEVEGVHTTGLCFEDKNVLVGEVYLVLARYSDSEEAKNNTDPRNRDGDLFYNVKMVELPSYDLNKPLEEQNQDIIDIVNYYKNISDKK